LAAFFHLALEKSFLQLTFDDKRRKIGQQVRQQPKPQNAKPMVKNTACWILGKIDDLTIADRGYGNHGHVQSFKERSLLIADRPITDGADQTNSDQGYPRPEYFF
jgi:hypothetical protein